MKRIERFDKYMKYRGLNDNKVTVQLGLSGGTIAKSRLGNRDLSDRVIEKIRNFYRDLNIGWLITGDGEMINKNTVQESPRPPAGKTPEENSSITALVGELKAARQQVDRLIAIVEEQMKVIQELKK